MPKNMENPNPDRARRGTSDIGMLPMATLAPAPTPAPAPAPRWAVERWELGNRMRIAMSEEYEADAKLSDAAVLCLMT